jgi:hypothetical protein
VAVDEVQAVLARDAYRRFGRGRHKASLNLGDCFSYALATATGEPLLFKGVDFGRMCRWRSAWRIAPNSASDPDESPGIEAHAGEVEADS